MENIRIFSIPMEATHLTKKYPHGRHGRRQTCLQPSVPGVDDIFDVAGAESPGHPHPHPHYDPADHNHGKMGSVGKEEIGGKENDRKWEATRKLWTKFVRDNWSGI